MRSALLQWQVRSQPAKPTWALGFAPPLRCRCSAHLPLDRALSAPCHASPHAMEQMDLPAEGCLCSPPGRRLEGLGLLFLAALVGCTYAPTLRCVRRGACRQKRRGTKRPPSLTRSLPHRRRSLAYRLPLPPSPSVMAASRGCLELALLLLVLLAVTWRRAARRARVARDGEAQQPLLPGRQQRELQQAVVHVEEGAAGATAPRPLLLRLPATLLAALEIG